MSQPPQDPRYPWGPPEAPSSAPGGASAVGSGAAEPTTTYGQQPGHGQGAPLGQPGQHPGHDGPAPGYAQPAAYGQHTSQGYGQPYGQGQYGYTGLPYGQHGQQGLGPRTAAPGGTIALLIASGLLFLFTFLTVVGLGFAAPVVLSIVGLVKHRVDPALTSRLTRIGWIVFAIVAVLDVIAITVFVLLIVHSANSGSSGFDTSFDTSWTTTALTSLARG